MNKMLSLAILLGAATAAPGIALADQNNWSGISIGIGGGAGAVVSDITAVPGPAGLPFDLGLDGLGSEGIFGTVSAGIDYQFARQWVIGAFIDYDFSNIETSFNANFFGAGINGKYEVEDMFTVGGRLGFLPNPNTLIYGLIGYTSASVSDLVISGSGVGTPLSIGIPSFDGFTVGGGIETVLFKNVTLKGEYRYTEFDRESLNLESAFPGAAALVDVRSEPSLHTGRVSVNYKFNFGGGHTESLK